MRTSASPRTHLRKNTPPLKAADTNRPVRRFAREAANESSSALNGSTAHESQTAAGAIEICVRQSLEQYFVNLDGAKPHALHDMVLRAFERPLLAFAMEKCKGNQSSAATLLGINRNTLRKKLTEYGLG